MNNAKKQNEVDMLNGPFARKLVAVALPIAAISILQQLFNVADVAVVGKFAGETALAAVGANTPICTTFITFFTGLSTGSNVAISTLIGMGEKSRVRTAVHTIAALALICFLLVIGIGEALARPLLTVISTPENIIGDAVLYLRIYLFAVAFSVLYNFASAILRSKGDTKRPMYCLIASGILNVVLNLVFVIGLHMDVAGVAIATLIANAGCAAACLLLLLKETDEFRLDVRKLCLDGAILSHALRIGVPAGISAALFSASNILIQAGVNSFGSDCIAGNTAAVNFEYISYFIMIAFAQAATTFISQNYGAKQYDRCRKIFRFSLIIGGLACACLSCLFFFGSRFWIGLFTDSESVYEFAMVRMTCLVLLEWITTFNEMPAAGLRSMGISLLPTLVAIFWGVLFRLVYLFTIFRSIHTIWCLMLLYPISWVCVGITMMILYYVMRRKKFAVAD